MTREGGWSPSWSPDGTSIAFTGDGQVFVVNADGTDERQQTTFRSVRIPHVYQPRAARWLVASDWWLVNSGWWAAAPKVDFMADGRLATDNRPLWTPVAGGSSHADHFQHSLPDHSTEQSRSLIGC